MICRLPPRVGLILLSIYFVFPGSATAQQAPVDSAPAARWQQWIAHQKRLPVGAWAYHDALDDNAVLDRYLSSGFNILPKTKWSPGAILPANSSAALDLESPTDRSVESIQQAIRSGPTPSVVLLGQELTPDEFMATGEQADAISVAAGGAALPLNSLLPNWYVYFDRLNITYEQYIEQFMAQAKPEALMAVDLPLMADGTDRIFYYDELEVLRRESIEHNIGLFGVVQAIGHGPRYRQPSASDLRWQVYSYLAYGAKGLWYYFFAGSGTDDNLTTGLAWYPKHLGPAQAPHGFGVEQSAAAKQALETVRQMNQEVAALSPTLLKLRSAAVFYSGKVLPPGIDSMRDDAVGPFAQFNGEDFLVGFFGRGDHPSSVDDVLIVNTRHGQDTPSATYDNSVSFTLKPPFSSIDVVDAATGNPRPLQAGQTGYILHLPGGQGVLLHCH